MLKQPASPGQRGQDCDECRISLTVLQYTEWQQIDFLSPLSTDSCPPHPHCWIASKNKNKSLKKIIKFICYMSETEKIWLTEPLVILMKGLHLL